MSMTRRRRTVADRRVAAPPRRTIARPAVFAAWGVLIAAALFIGASLVFVSDPESLKARAEAAERAGDRPAALKAWQEYHATGRGGGRSRLGEARAYLAMNLAARAERSLIKASEADPADPEPWRLRLEMLRIENRAVEAAEVGRIAHEAVAPGKRRGLLRELTLALLLFETDLDDVSEDHARAALKRWIDADPEDLGARASLYRRMAARPRESDPDRDTRIADLEGILKRSPEHVDSREALVTALADAGEPDKGRAYLDAWPISGRDARYDRLRGRWALEYDKTPDEAVATFERALAVLPHDWRTRYRLARANRALGRLDNARQEADAVTRLRELLDPNRLAPRLARDLGGIDDPNAILDLAELCREAGLLRLSDAWRREAVAPFPSR